MPRIIAIDYGSKRTGIAVTDPMQIIATALATIPSHEVIKFLQEYIKKEAVEKFVVGEVYNYDGSPAQSMPLINAFVKQLNKNFPQIPVEREDESFTSKQAFQTMIDSGIGRQKRRDKKLVDKIAAVLILQSFLERNKE